ncbi:DUF4031 domain-containing protein [Zafaria sp. Z1313]|uniref:DUF4031 domain-containing protein n=1 Tax=Zafaria sp. Z1313 TaxID=3423202 RepID=UPI003D301D79
MAILIDPPLWPAHGTMFSHLVSDASLEELHAFALAAGLPERAFDRDHYDVPERRHAGLVELGAVPVTATELVRRLVRSGLRVPARQRPERLDPVLLDHWERLLPGGSGVGEQLLGRWAEPHRHYHDRTHLMSVLRGIERLAGAGEPEGPFPRAVRLAAWFHDAVYEGVPGRDEEDSADLAAQLLGGAGLPAREVEETARLVRATASHRPEADDAAARLLCDADLEVLGRDPAAYLRYADAVRRDYAHVEDAAFRTGRAAVLRTLLAAPTLYSTPSARRWWESAARRNLADELRRLEAPAG